MSFSRIAASIFAATLLASSAFAQAPAPAAPVVTPGAAASANGPVTRSQIPALVKEALINDPDILNEALKKLQDKQDEDAKKEARAAVAKNKDALLASDAPSVGDAGADVTVVEFFDYHCGYCKQLLPAVTKLIAEDKKVRVIFKEYPVLSEDSITAARAALAVNRIAKDKYFEFHTALMDAKGKFDDKTVGDIAKKLGIDSAKLKAEMAKPDIVAMLDKNHDLGTELGIRGTPAVIVGDDMFPGAIPYEELKKAVDAARAAKKPVAAPVAAAPAPAAHPALVAPVAAPAAPAVAPVPPAAPIPAPVAPAAPAPAPKP